MTVTDNRDLQRFELLENGETAFANYRRSGLHVIIPHVEAPPALRGTGAASRCAAGWFATATGAARSIVTISPPSTFSFVPSSELLTSTLKSSTANSA